MPGSRSRYAEAADELRSASRVALITHRDPDGDGLGAESCLVAVLRALGKIVAVVNESPTPAHYRFLPHSEAFWPYRPGSDAVASADLVVLLDAADPSRTGRMEAEVRAAPGRSLVIDHHGPPAWGDVRLVDPGAVSTTALIVDLMDELGVALEPETATALLTGVIADTDGFRAPDTTARAHQVAARLMAAGAARDVILDNLFRWSHARLRLRGEMLAGSTLLPDARLAYSSITRQQLNRAGLGADATEGLVEELLSIRDVDVGVLFYEEEEGVRLSLRSRGDFDVGSIARELGGGGHPHSAGARLEGTLHNVRNRVVPWLTLRLTAGIA